MINYVEILPAGVCLKITSLEPDNHVRYLRQFTRHLSRHEWEFVIAVNSLYPCSLYSSFPAYVTITILMLNYHILIIYVIFTALLWLTRPIVLRVTMAMTAAATVQGIQENVLSMEQRTVKLVNSTKTLFGFIKACHNIEK